MRTLALTFAALAFASACTCGKSPPPPPGCTTACSAHQKCDTATSACVCDNACPGTGAACDPAGSNQIGACVADSNGCFYVSGLAACPGAAQVCVPGEAACKCSPTAV